MLSGSLPQNGLQTCHGEDFSEAVAAVTGGREGEEGRQGGEGGERGREGRGHPVVAVGVNCSDPDFVEVCTVLLE